MEEIKKGQYRHYKGGLYNVVAFAKHSETLEDLVVYQRLEDNSFWVRPKEMFLETINQNGKDVHRFEFLGDSQQVLLKVNG